MKLRILLSALIITISSAAVSAENPYFLPAGTSSASAEGGSFSMLKNPVFSRTPGHAVLAYQYMRFTGDENKGNHFAALDVFGLSLIYGRYAYVYDNDGKSIDADSNFYQINKGFFFKNMIGFGGGFSMASGPVDELDGYRSWNCGFLMRPSSYLSLGLTFRDLKARINEDDLKRSETWSASLRPLKWFTISADGERMEGEKYHDMDWTFSGSVLLPAGVSITASGSTEENYTWGISMPFFARFEQPASVHTAAYGGAGNFPSHMSGEISVSREKDIKAKSIGMTYGVLNIKLHRKYGEQKKESLFLSGGTTFSQLLRGIGRAAEDDSINCLFLEIDSMPMGFGKLQELRNEVLKFRKTGKKVFAQINYNGNREYYIASAADRIFFTPNSSFSLRGLSAEVYFFKGLLDKVGVKFESIKYGKYKSFNEAYTRKEMSPELRENMRSLLYDLNEQFIGDIIKARKIDRQVVDDLFKDGIYSPLEAKEKGFIDEVMYRDEAIDTLPESKVVVDMDSFIEEKTETETWGPIPEIAVIHVGGTIVSGRSSTSDFSETTGDITYRETLQNVFSDSNVKAVVIRVNSGGGSAAASDYMWKELMLQKKKNDKPVVFSFGDIAASGGYYIACSGDRIFANRGTITGSIGVIAGKISLKELYGKLGINKDVVKMSEFADIFSESKDLNAEERKILQKGVNFIYHRFTGKVMEARKITKSEIAGTAEGRVFTGNQASKKKLTDQTGGIIAALEYAKNKAEIEGHYRIVNLPERKGSVAEILSSGQTKMTGQIRDIIEAVENYSVLKDRILYMSPYVIEIK